MPAPVGAGAPSPGRKSCDGAHRKCDKRAGRLWRTDIKFGELSERGLKGIGR